MKKIKLIVVFLFILLVVPNTVFAQKEAGASASIESVVPMALNSTTEAEMSLKRKVIYEMLTEYNSPLVGEVDTFIRVCAKYSIDCYLLPSITGVESTFGKFILPGSYNPFGWGGGLIMFESWADCIEAVGKGLSENYYAKGADTIEKIAPIYAASPTWAQKVTYFHNRFTELEDEKRLKFARLAVQW